jgi:hypothetical protein
MGLHVNVQAARKSGCAVCFVIGIVYLLVGLFGPYLYHHLVGCVDLSRTNNMLLCPVSPKKKTMLRSTFINPI